MVLNSLAEEKLQASIRCLARHGRFLEIGKYDLSNNSPLGKYGCSNSNSSSSKLYISNGSVLQLYHSFIFILTDVGAIFV